MSSSKVLALLLFSMLSFASLLSAQNAVIKIDTSPAALASRSPKELEVANRGQVDIIITKSPVEVCTIETKREEVPEEPNPLVPLLTALTGTFKPAGADDCDKLEEDQKKPPEGLATAEIELRFRLLAEGIDRIEQDLKNYKEKIEARAKSAKELVSCRPVEGDVPVPKFCESQEAYAEQKKRVEDNLTSLIEEAVPSLEVSDARVAQLQSAIQEAAKFKPTDATAKQFSEWLTWINRRLECAVARLRQLKDSAGRMAASRDTLAKFLETSKGYTPKSEQKETLAPDKDAKLTGSIACKNFFTNVATIMPVPFIITYQGQPRFSISAGILYSSLDKRKLGTEAIRTGDSTFRTVFAETERESFQFIPFTFGAVRLYPWKNNVIRDVRVNLSAGIGANSVSGSQEIEYFLGPSIAYKNIQVHLGVHRGKFPELKGGYQVGEDVPPDFPGISTRRVSSTHIAAALSYRLPLN